MFSLLLMLVISTCSDHFKNKGAFITFTKALKPAFTTFDAVVCVMLWGVWYVVH